MKEKYVELETAILALEKDCELIKTRVGIVVYPVPTQSLLQKWFREVHDIHINPEPYRETADHTGDITGYYMGDIRRGCKGQLLNFGEDNYSTYEEALEAGLLFALKLI